MAYLYVCLMIAAFTSFSNAVPSALPVKAGLGSVTIPVQELPIRPYAFGFQFGDGLGMNQYREEMADDAGVIKGSYGYLDPSGVTRIVEYTADKDGYRAVIRTNEPGAAGQSPANAVYFVRPPPATVIAQGVKAVVPKI